MKNDIKKLRTRLRAAMKAIGKNRDVLTRIVEDAEMEIDCCDRAIEDMQSAVDALSELV